jgi:hypothetical protein
LFYFAYFLEAKSGTRLLYKTILARDKKPPVAFLDFREDKIGKTRSNPYFIEVPLIKSTQARFIHASI